DGLRGIGEDEIFGLERTPNQFGVCSSNCSGKKLKERASRTDHLTRFNVKASNVGPNVPRGRRLGPDLWNNDLGFLRLGSIKNPIKQFCISSQFCSPQKI